MIFTKTSMLTGITRTMDLPVTEQQLELYQKGVLIQDAMSNLTAAEREFILTGITDEEWNEYGLNNL